MKIIGRVYADSGYRVAGVRAYELGIPWDRALSNWRTYQLAGRKWKRNSLWIDGALRAFRSAGGYVPKEMIPYRP
jgi:hypothetical protein